MSFSFRKKLAAAIIIKNEEAKKKKQRRYWAKNWLLERNTYGHMSLIQELAENNPDDFKNYMRMTDSAFNILFEKVRHRLTKQDTRMRKAIPAKERLVATLRMLATGRSYEDLKFSVAISPQSLGVIIPETCRILFEELKEQYMKFPTTTNEWKDVARDFDILWNFPNCGGAVDGKHVRIVAPPKSGSFYYNYKGFHSIVLLAIVNANYEFIYADVGTNGRISDGGVIEKTNFFKHLTGNKLNLPDKEDNVNKLNFVFIGDEAFSLQRNFLKPYAQRELTKEKRIFNYRLSRARRVSENAFGIMASTFRIYHTPMNMSLENIDHIVLATCVLHNFLRRHAKITYMSSSMIDNEDINENELVEGEWRRDPLHVADLQRNLQHGNNSEEAKECRNNYLQYFNSNGSVPWQENMIKR